MRFITEQATLPIGGTPEKTLQAEPVDANDGSTSHSRRVGSIVSMFPHVVRSTRSHHLKHTTRAERVRAVVEAACPGPARAASPSGAAIVISYPY